MTDPLWQMMDRFEEAFPSIWGKTWIIDPRVEEDWKAADTWVRDRLREAGMNEREIQRQSSGLFVRLRSRAPQFFGAIAHHGDVVAGVVVPVVSDKSWAERIPGNLTYSERQEWSVPDLEPFEALEHQYAVYTFDHETAHAVFHNMPKAERPPARGHDPGKITKQQDETFADMAGGLGLAGHFSPEVATDTIRRIAHLRAMEAINHRDTEHLATRGLKRAIGTIGNPSDATLRWQQAGMAGAKALAEDVSQFAYSKQELDALASALRTILPIDTFSAENALAKTSTIGAETSSAVVYELMRDYVDAVEALVPEDRVDPSALLKAKLALRRNPIAKFVDEAHPRIEAVVAETHKRLAIHEAGRQVANQPATRSNDRVAPRL